MTRGLLGVICAHKACGQQAQAELPIQHGVAAAPATPRHETPSPFFPAIRDRGCPKAWRRLYSGSLLLLHQLGCRKHIDSKLLFSSACACWFLQELSANSVQGVRVWDFAGQIDGELQQAPPHPLGVRRIPPKGDSVAKTSLLFVAHQISVCSSFGLLVSFRLSARLLVSFFQLGLAPFNYHILLYLLIFKLAG